MLWAFLLFVLVFSAGPLAAKDTEAAQWQQALTAVAAGKHEDALPSLERLVSLNPANVDYRFELALTLIKLGQDGRARHHLELLRSTALAAGARQAVAQLSGQIDVRRKLTGYFSFGILPETNVGKQTEDGTILIGGIPFQLQQTGEPGISARVNTGFGYTTALTPHLQARTRLDAAAKLNEEQAYRDVSIIGRAGLAFAKTTDRSTGLGLILGARWIADRPYSDTVGAYFEYAQRAGQKGRFDFNLQFANNRHRDGTPDHNIAFARLSYSHGISANAQLRFGVFHQQTNSRDLTVAGNNTSVNFGADYAFRGGLIAGFDLSVSRDSRNGFNSAFFTEAREDHKIKADFTIHHRDFRIFNFAPQLNAGIERNKSNYSLVDYTNKYMGIGFTRKF